MILSNIYIVFIRDNFYDFYTQHERYFLNISNCAILWARRHVPSLDKRSVDLGPYAPLKGIGVRF